MKVNLNQYNNDWYKPGKGKLMILIWYCINATFLNTYFLPSSSFKVFLLKLFGAKIGEGVVIKPNVNVKYPWRLEIGNYTWIGEEVWIDNLENVKIGNNVKAGEKIAELGNSTVNGDYASHLHFQLIFL